MKIYLFSLILGTVSSVTKIANHVILADATPQQKALACIADHPNSWYNDCKKQDEKVVTSEAIKYFNEKYEQCVEAKGYAKISLASLFDISAFSFVSLFDSSPILSLPEAIDVDPDNEGTDTTPTESNEEIARDNFIKEQDE